MGTRTYRGEHGSGRALTAPEAVVYLVATGYVAAGVLVVPGAGWRVAGSGLLATGLVVCPSVLVLPGALALRRSGPPRPAWWSVSGWYVAGAGVGTAALAWLVVGSVAVPAPLPDRLGGGALVAAGSVGGGLGFVGGVWRARRGRRIHAPARLLAATGEAAWLFTPDRSETLYVNPGYERLFDQPADRLAADPTALLDAAHPDDRETLRAELETLSDGSSVEFEFRTDPERGSDRWVWLSGRPVYRDGRLDAVACVARDITSRRHHRERLVNLHDATRQLFRAETETEAVRIATDAAEEVLGLRVNTVWLYDADDEELVPTATSPAAEAAPRSLPTFKSGDSVAWEVYESGEAQVYDDVRTAPGGRNAPTRSEVVLPLGEFGVFMAGSTAAERFEGWQLSLGKVLAANVEAALARIEQTRRLEESRRALEQRNERLDEFTSVVSHDLRNPLAVARGHLELVRDEVDSGHVDTIDDALERMGTLIDDLLALAREGETIDDLQPVDIRPHARQCWTRVETDRAELAVADEATIEADGDRLAQLFENLFRNSVEHGSTGGASRARRGARSEASGASVASDSDDGGTPVTVTVGTLPDGFYVEDDGPGIPADERETVFEAGYTTEREGTGFGLSIVQTIADAHGWTITATEGSEGGARFEVTGVTFD